VQHSDTRRICNSPQSYRDPAVNRPSWLKATPAFNIDVCRRHGVSPLEFNGREDSIFHPYSLEGKKFMEYLQYHGAYADIPVADIVAATETAYGKTRVRKWINALEISGGEPTRDFTKEDVL
jgi:hypothetical protein